MSNQASAEKKKFINFKPGIRKEIIKAVAFMGIFMVIMLIGVRVFGRSNGMAFGMAIMGVLMTVTVDMTLEPAKNLIMLIGSNVFMVFMSYLGYGLFPENTGGRIAMMTVTTFIMFFTAIYLFTSEEYGNTYMPLLLSFSLLLYYNGNTTVTSAMGSGTAPGSTNIVAEMLTRMGIYAGAACLGMLINFLVHGRKFRKKMRNALDGAIKNLEEQIHDIYRKEKKPAELKEQASQIEAALSGIEGAVGPKMSIRYNWQSGHDMIRTVTILRRITKTLSENYIETGEQLPENIYKMLIDMLQSIDRFEKDEISEAEVVTEFDRLYQHMNTDADHSAVIDSLRSEIDDFIEGEVQHADSDELRPSVLERFFANINVYTCIFALKTAALAAAGVLVVSLLRLPMGYMFPLYVGITAQPYLELTKGSVKKRIINTLYAVGIILVSFSITQSVWVHILLLIGITLVADMFFQFDFMVMMGSMMAIVINVIMQPEMLYSYSFYRLGYIAAACVLIQVVDMFIFPRSISDSLSAQMRDSIAINNELRSALADDSCDYTVIQDIITKKRIANQRIRNTNRFAKSENVTAYLLSEEEWINRLTMINHRLKNDNVTPGQLRRFLEASEPSASLTPRQHNILTALDEVLEDIAAPNSQNAACP